MTAKTKRPTAKQMQGAVDKWNAKHSEKTLVRYWPGVREGDGLQGWTQTAACLLGGHTAGVYIGGAGFVALTHVEGP